MSAPPAFQKRPLFGIDTLGHETSSLGIVAESVLIGTQKSRHLPSSVEMARIHFVRFPATQRHSVRQPAMNCDIFKILCLRANGEFTCNYGAGQKVNLGWATAAPDWSVRRLFADRGYALARAMFRRGIAPWATTCEQCVGLQRNEPFSHDVPTKRLEKLLVEPSLACALRCPSCSRVDLATERPGSTFLSVDIWRRVLASLREEGYLVDLFFFCGLGEPLAHPQLEDIIDCGREFFPTTPVAINTNGNYKFKDAFPRGSYPDRLIVSVDGLDQSSYERYRINGNVARALQFMHDARHAPGRAPAVEWKYILFRYDDSDVELIAAQQKAAKLDIDSLQFVLTHTVEKSTRFTPENIEELPIVWSRAYPETTPNLYFKRPEARPLSVTNSEKLAGFGGADRVRINIDYCRSWSGRLMLRGWAMGYDGSGPRRLRIFIGEHEAGVAEVGLAREDVWHVYPSLGNRRTGFNAVCEIPHALTGAVAKVTLVYDAPDGASFQFPVDYDLGHTGAEQFNHHCP
ncbi:MAG: radical SAM protein [Opitutaceae bacterium]|nr:radical SAM protein [Opitutaceae bacterium]